MPDSRDDRYRARRDRTQNRSSLNGSRSSKLPPPRERTITSTPGAAAELAQRLDHRARRVRALDVRLGDEDAGGREAAADRGDDVFLGSGIVAGDEADPAREERQRTLPFEHAFGCELLLQALERREVISEPEPLDRKGAHAEVATCLEELRAAEHVHTLPVHEVEAKGVELVPCGIVTPRQAPSLGSFSVKKTDCQRALRRSSVTSPSTQTVGSRCSHSATPRLNDATA